MSAKGDPDTTRAAGEATQSAGEATRAAERGPGGALGLLGASLTPELAMELLREVIDPELGVNIVDLGLVYELAVQRGEVAIEMTLTTPGCPLGDYLEDEIRACLRQLPQVDEVSIELVWEPPWEPEKMSDVAREQLGWYR